MSTLLSSSERADIPWHDEASWQELQIAISAICSSLGEQETDIRRIAQQIRHHYQLLEQPMDVLCGRACTTCQEVCCLRATLWYDLSDLLFLYLISAELPAGQIHRLPGGVCCNLGQQGCMLPRWQRPFICSWYICGAQQNELQTLPDLAGVKETVEELRSLRKRLLAACLEAVTP